MRHYVDVFIGQSRAQGWIRTLESYGFGEMVQPSEFPPRRLPYAFDCQRFGMWQRGEQGDAEKEAKWRARYEQALDAVWRYNHLPEVLIVPDYIADWAQSKTMTLEWLPRVRKHGPPYLSVQDGAEVCEVANLLKEHDFAGIFVGGSLAWKIRTGATWVTLAHGAGRKCHIGRVGTEQRVRWAIRIGADSIDSCLPLWSAGNLRRFLAGFGPPKHASMPLFAEEDP